MFLEAKVENLRVMDENIIKNIKEDDNKKESGLD